MARKHSYTITHSNNTSEKEAIDYLVKSDHNFINPDKESRKAIMQILNIDKKYSRAFDLIQITGHSNLDKAIQLNEGRDITLIELKTTKKNLPNNPRGFFFGATENEFNLARQLGEKFKFCFVSLHPDSKSYALLSLEELESSIKERLFYS